MFRRLRPVTLTLVLVVVGAAIAVLLLSETHHSSTGASSASATAPESQFQGAPLPGATAAASFTLTDQYGDGVSLDEYRGQVVVLTFLYSTCGDACVVIGQQIRGALDELQEAHARLPAVLVVSADPTADTPAHVSRFLSEVSLTGRVQYLTGTAAQLRSVWHAYGVKPASAGAAVFDEYAPVLLIDPSGHKRVLFESEELTPEGIGYDVERLAGDPTHP
jgi:protein SCO1/2